MATRRSIAMLVALGFAGAAYAAQTPAPPDPADTQAAPPPTDVPSPATDPATTPGAPDSHEKGTVGKTPHEGMAGTSMKMVGMQVISPSGESLGSVIDVTMDAQHQPEYAVISTGNDTMTAIPYSAVASMVRENKIIMDRTRLENSPQVAQSELRDKSNSKWRADADKYWSAAGVRMATPGAGTDNPDKPKPKQR
jgi:sporulation protein YlmC with PRC-barrel domain